jgi:hypothetical protein
VNDDQIIKALEKCSDYLSLNSMPSDALRYLGWCLIKGLAFTLEVVEGGLAQVYKLLYFFSSSQVTSFINQYMPVVFALTGVALGYLGWMIIIRQKTDYNRLVVNFLVAITIFVALPWSMGQAADLVLYGQKGLQDNMSASTSVIKGNITDVYLLDKANFTPGKMKTKNYIQNDNDIRAMDINEPMDTGGWFSSSPLSDNGKAILTKKLGTQTGKMTLNDLQSYWFSKESYYRYSWHPVLILVELIAVMIAISFSIFKTSQLIMELGFLKTLTMGTLFTDLDSGQRTKKLVLQIRNTFIVLYLIALTLKFFLLFTDYISNQSINAVVKVLVILAAAFSVIDGPNIIEQLFGIDAGLSSASKALLGMLGAAHMAKEAGKGLNVARKKATQMAKNVGHGVAVGAGAVAGSAKGALDGFEARRAAGAGDGGSGTAKPGMQGQGGKPGAMDKMKTDQDPKKNQQGGLGKEAGKPAAASVASSSKAGSEASAAMEGAKQTGPKPSDALAGFAPSASGAETKPASELMDGSGSADGSPVGDALAGFTPSGSLAGQGEPTAAGGFGKPGDSLPGGASTGKVLPSKRGTGSPIAGMETYGNGTGQTAPSARSLGALPGSGAAINSLSGGAQGSLPGGVAAIGTGSVGSNGFSGPGSSSFAGSGTMSAGQSSIPTYQSSPLTSSIGQGARRALSGSQPLLMPTHANLPLAMKGSVQHANQAVSAASHRVPTTNQTLGQAITGGLINTYANTAQKVYDSSPLSAYRNAYDLTRNSIAGPPPAETPIAADYAFTSLSGGPAAGVGGGSVEASRAAMPRTQGKAVAPSAVHAFGTTPVNPSHFDPPVPEQLYEYSAHNRKSIMAQFPNVQAVGSKSFWSSHGLSVQVSARPISISAPITDDDGKVILNDSGKPVGYESVEVYDISQTSIARSAIPNWLAENSKNKRSH